MSLTEFMKRLDSERMKMLNSMVEERKTFMDFVSLESLRAKT